MDSVLERHAKHTSDNKYIENKKRISKFIQDRFDEVSKLKGKMHKHPFFEDVVIDEDIFNESIKEMEHFKDSESQEDRDAYQEAIESFRNEIGTKQKRYVCKRKVGRR